MSSWILKISHRLIPDKEFSKELKINPDLSIIQLILSACRAFDLSDYKSYRIQYNKVNLPLLDSIRGTGVIQGCTLNLVKRTCNSSQKYNVTCNFQIHSDPTGIIKSVTEYSSDTLLLEALQKVTIGNNPLNTLVHSTKLPVVSILGAKLKAQDLTLLEKFSFSDLEMKGRYVISIHYIEESNADFQSFLDRLDYNLRECIDQTADYGKNLESSQDMNSKPNLVPCASERKSILDSSVAIRSDNSLNVKFKAYKIIPDTTPSDDLPDSFYDISSVDLANYQKGFKQATQALVDRPFMSAKNKNNSNAAILKRPKDSLINLKFVFADQVQIHASFPSDAATSCLFEFILTQVIDMSDVGIELWHGPPYKILQNTKDKTIVHSGISGASRIIVKCNKTPMIYRDIKFENCI